MRTFVEVLLASTSGHQSVVGAAVIIVWSGGFGLGSYALLVDYRGWGTRYAVSVAKTNAKAPARWSLLTKSARRSQTAPTAVRRTLRLVARISCVLFAAALRAELAAIALGRVD